MPPTATTTSPELTEEGDLEVDISVPCPAWRKALPGVDALGRAAVRAALAAAPARPADAELGLVLADDAFVRDLNRRYRGLDRPTNVLAFPVDDPEEKTAGAPLMLGDVVVAFETAAREADAEGKTLGDHLAHLIVHGVLHLLGFDHDTDDAADRMESLEARALAGLGVPDPYRMMGNHERS